MKDFEFATKLRSEEIKAEYSEEKKLSVIFTIYKI